MSERIQHTCRYRFFSQFEITWLNNLSLNIIRTWSLNMLLSWPFVLFVFVQSISIFSHFSIRYNLYQWKFIHLKEIWVEMKHFLGGWKKVSKKITKRNFKKQKHLSLNFKYFIKELSLKVMSHMSWLFLKISHWKN